MWVVTWMTLTFGVESIIETSSVPVRWASSSVWPGNSWPAACSAALLSGAVQIASTSPASASCGGALDVAVGGLAGGGRDLAPREVVREQVEVDDVGGRVERRGSRAACSSRARSPITTVSSSVSCSAATTISGPIPAPSPMVTAISM